METLARQAFASLKTDGRLYFYQIDGWTEEIKYFDTDEQAIAWFWEKVK